MKTFGVITARATWASMIVQKHPSTARILGLGWAEGRSWGEIESDSSRIYTREMWELLIVS